jgi:8-oxo-dGTP diphosphatase
MVEVLRRLYVVGFLFDNRGENVLLIRKTKPPWMKGKLNGIGGKIEHGESPINAMIREFKEETGCNGPLWKLLGTLENPDFEMYVFYDFSDRAMLEARTQVDDVGRGEGTIEYVNYFPVFPHTIDRMPNLRWLIPMCLSHGSDLEHAEGFQIIERGSDGLYDHAQRKVVRTEDASEWSMAETEKVLVSFAGFSGDFQITQLFEMTPEHRLAFRKGLTRILEFESQYPHNIRKLANSLVKSLDEIIQTHNMES